MASQLRRVRISISTAVVMIFVFVSSGAFGMEDMVSWSGPGFTLLLLLLLPIFWAMPMALVCSELGSAMPEEGGYYVWTRRALGEFWGFQSGWWSWLCQFVDSAVYVALIMAYVQGWWPQLGFNGAWAIGVAIIAVFAYINIRGLNVVALSSIVFTVIIMAPFVVLTVLGFAHWQGLPWQPFLPTGETLFGGLEGGLAIGLWMYSGFDSMSVLAGEIERPRRIIPKALMISLPIIVVSYFLPTLAGLAGVGSYADWSTTAGGSAISFVEIARLLGGPVLAAAMLLAAVVSNLALYQEYLGMGARPAWAMAEDGLLPKALYKTHGKYGTPYVSIIFLAAVNAVLLRWGFTTLIVIDVFLNMLYYILIFVAAVRLRQTEPRLERPFKVWGNTAVLAMICTPAVLIAVIELFINGADYLIGGVVAAMSGAIAYIVFKSMYGRSAAR